MVQVDFPFMYRDSPPSCRIDRRIRTRRAWQAPGWVYLGETVTEVELRDISRDVQEGGEAGVGFISPCDFPAGESVHLKVGMGPLKHPTHAIVAYSRRRPDGKFWIGAILGQRMAEAA